MGRRTQVLCRWAREFAAGVDAGNAIRLGLPVRAEVLRDPVVGDATASDGFAGFDGGAGRPAGNAAVPVPLRLSRDHARAPGTASETVAATAVPGRCRRIPSGREGA